jgi:hypothetical protein
VWLGLAKPWRDQKISRDGLAWHIFWQLGIRLEVDMILARNASAVLALAVIGLVPVYQAHALEVQSSVGAYLTLRLCEEGTDPPCNRTVPGSAITGAAGEPGDSNASLVIEDDARGSASLGVSLSGQIGAPVIKAIARSLPGTRANTNLVALQRYEYLGTEPQRRAFGGILTYQSALVREDGLSGVNAAIEVFRMKADSVDLGDNATENFFALFFRDFIYLPGYESFGFVQHIDTNSNAGGVHNLSIDIDLEPGDVVWVYVLLQTPATDGSVVDASRTLITGWDDPTDLVPAAVYFGGPGERLAALRESASGVGPGQSLVNKIVTAEAYYAVPDIVSACAVMDDFIKQLRGLLRATRIEVDLGEALIAEAGVIKTSLGCK